MNHGDYDKLCKLARLTYWGAKCASVCGCERAATLHTVDKPMCEECYETSRPVALLSRLRKETKGYTRLLYHCNYWDGPLSGVMLWEGKRAWFESYDDGADAFRIADQEEYERGKGEKSYVNGRGETRTYTLDLEDFQELIYYRFFAVYQIPDEEMDKIDQRHDLFRRYVGAHTDYNADGSRGSGTVISGPNAGELGDMMPRDYHHKFYDTVGSNRDEITNKIKIGEFRM